MRKEWSQTYSNDHYRYKTDQIDELPFSRVDKNLLIVLVSLIMESWYQFIFSSWFTRFMEKYGETEWANEGGVESSSTTKWKIHIA